MVAVFGLGPIIDIGQFRTEDFDFSSGRREGGAFFDLILKRHMRTVQFELVHASCLELLPTPGRVKNPAYLIKNELPVVRFIHIVVDIEIVAVGLWIECLTEDIATDTVS